MKPLPRPQLSRRRLLGFAGAALGTGLVGGCSIHPLYAPNAFGTADKTDLTVQQQLRQVQVTLIPERDGQLLRLALQDQLQAGEDADFTRYTLRVNYSISSSGLGLLGDNTTTYARIIATATWFLTTQDTTSHNLLATNTAQAVDGLNEFDNQPFGMDLETEAIHKRLADAIAGQIVTRLAHYFTATGRANEQAGHKA
jgi:LPS-assembly lipoprotein